MKNSSTKDSWKAVYLKILCLALLLAPAVVVISAQEDQNLLDIQGPDGQESPDANELLDRAFRAAGAENYESTLRALTQGRELFPEDWRFPSYLGDLYYDQGLYGLALVEYQRVMELTPEDSVYRLRLADTYGFLNRNEESRRVLLEGLTYHPDDPFLIQTLGWLHYKLDEYSAGARLMEEALERLGPSARFSMTLGTLYSALDLFDTARTHYQEALDQALQSQDWSFASVVYYNLSILESTVHNFDVAWDLARLSVETQERPSGLWALGEYYQYRLDFHGALRLYRRGEILDETPISRLSLALLHGEFGYLDQAMAYLDEIDNSRDNAWMYNFGVDPDSFARDLEKLRVDLYEGYINLLGLRPRTFWQRILDIPEYLRLQLRLWYHGQRLRELHLRIARSAQGRGNGHLSWWPFYQAYKGQGSAARKYLERIEAYDVERNPSSALLYQLEWALMEPRIEVLEALLPALESPWYAAEQVQVLQALIPLYRGRNDTVNMYQALNRLYSLNPGALLPKGFHLPLELVLFGEGPDSSWASRLLRAASLGGHQVSQASVPGVLYRLNLNYQGGRLEFQLQDGEGLVIHRGAQSLDGMSQQSWNRAWERIFLQIHSVPPQQ